MLHYLLGPSIKQGPTITEVSGINFRNLNDDIVTQYGTSTPGKYMFRRVNSTKFVTDNFFLLELELLIHKLLQSKNIWSNRRDIHQLQIKLRTETWIKDTQDITFPEPDWNYLAKITNLKPYETQKDFLRHYPAVKKAYSLKGLLLDAKPGSGKTVSSLMWTVFNRKKKHIVVCPNSIVHSVWVEHIQNKFFKNPPKIWTSKDGTPVDTSAEYFIVHNDYLRTPQWFKLLESIFSVAGKGGVDMIIDECHNFNELSAAQTQNLIAAADHFTFSDVLPMSGTPLKALGREAYTVFACIDSFFVGTARERFLKSYGLSRDKLNDMLARRIGRVKFKIDSLVGLDKEPDIVRVPISFPGCENYTLKAIRMQMLTYIQERVKFYEQQMPTFLAFYTRVIDGYALGIQNEPGKLEQLAKYRQIVNKFRKHGFSSFTDNEDSRFAKEVEADIESGLRGAELQQFRNVKSAVKYVGLKIRGEALGNVLGKARMNAVKDIVSHAGLVELILNTEKKTLIFTSYADVLEECERYLTQANVGVLSAYGPNNKDRDVNVKLFASDPRYQAFVATFDSLKEGYPMLMANQEILMNAPWRDYELKQAKARIYRQGQDSPCRFWLIDLDTGKEPNITSRSIDILEWSKEQTEILLGQSSIDQPAFRTVMGAESYWVIDEEPTRPLLRSHATAMSLF